MQVGAGLASARLPCKVVCPLLYRNKLFPLIIGVLNEKGCFSEMGAINRPVHLWCWNRDVFILNICYGASFCSK